MPRKKPDWPYDCAPATNNNRRPCPYYAKCCRVEASGVTLPCEKWDVAVGIPIHQENVDYYLIRTHEDLRPQAIWWHDHGHEEVA